MKASKSKSKSKSKDVFASEPFPKTNPVVAFPVVVGRMKECSKELLPAVECIL